MKKEHIIRLVAGSLALSGVVLSYLISPQWVWLTVFVSINLIQSSFSGFCPLEMILDKLGKK